MDNAALQIGVWHSAQWNCLRHLLRTIWTPAEAEAALNELGVLPAIITQGHEWSFAATTLEEKKTVWIISVSSLCASDILTTNYQVLWLKMLLGGTNSPTGIYAIATVLEYLRWWTEEVYWTWFKKYILDPQLP